MIILVHENHKYHQQKDDIMAVMSYFAPGELGYS